MFHIKLYNYKCLIYLKFSIIIEIILNYLTIRLLKFNIYKKLLNTAKLK